MDALNLFCKKFTHEERGNGFNPKLFVADMSGNRTDCPNHPPGSHSSGDVFDILYFTNHPTSNFTQVYNHNADFRKKYPFVQLWEDGVSTGMFNVARNRRFFLEFFKCFPESLTMVHQRVYDLLVSGVNSSDRRLFFQFMQADEHPHWNHDVHAHIFLNRNYRKEGPELINWNYFKE